MSFKQLLSSMNDQTYKANQNNVTNRKQIGKSKVLAKSPVDGKIG